MDETIGRDRAHGNSRWHRGGDLSLGWRTEPGGGESRRHSERSREQSNLLSLNASIEAAKCGTTARLDGGGECQEPGAQSKQHVQVRTSLVKSEKSAMGRKEAQAGREAMEAEGTKSYEAGEIVPVPGGECGHRGQERPGEQILTSSQQQSPAWSR